MSRDPQRVRAAAVLERAGRTFADELGIDLARNTPSALYRWLCAATLFSARIRGSIALAAARALAEHGWTTPERMRAAAWEERTQALNRAGYARYDESTSRMLAESADLLIAEYRGDLRRLRERAGRDAGTERRLLKEFKGMGDVGADIFFREVQAVWPELYPFADRKALAAAARLELGEDAAALAGLVGREDLPRLVAGLVRIATAKDYDAILGMASR